MKPDGHNYCIQTTRCSKLMEATKLRNECHSECKWNAMYKQKCKYFTCEKHLYGRIISLRGEVRAHKTSLTPPFFIEMPVPKNITHTTKDRSTRTY